MLNKQKRKKVVKWFWERILAHGGLSDAFSCVNLGMSGHSFLNVFINPYDGDGEL